MKNKLKKCVICLLLISIGVLIGSLSSKKETALEEEIFVKKDVNTLSMMLETEAGSGNYELTTRSEWSTEGYVFNSELSKCENGGELSWDNTAKQVLMSSNVSDKCYVYFDKYNPITINNYSITSNGNSITITIDATAGTGTIAKYYYSKDNGTTYVESLSSTYTFNNLALGTYNIKAYVQDSNGKNSDVVSKNAEITSISLASYVVEQYNGVQGNNGIYHHDGTLTNGINDGSYRYAGANPGNYICLGSNESICPDSNLFRIIGVFGEEVKVIRAKSLGSKRWDDNSKNTWSNATLNSYLNKEYYASLSNTLKSKIILTKWNVGGNTWANIAKQPAKTAYQNEILNMLPGEYSTTGEIKYNAYIGLMYVSDYMYAVPQDKWTLVGYDIDATKDYRAAKSVNWLYSGIVEWTISRHSNSVQEAFYIYGAQVDDNDAHVGRSFEVRPVFYLSSSVTYKSGTGSSASDPIRIN